MPLDTITTVCYYSISLDALPSRSIHIIVVERQLNITFLFTYQTGITMNTIINPLADAVAVAYPTTKETFSFKKLIDPKTKAVKREALETLSVTLPDHNIEQLTNVLQDKDTDIPTLLGYLSRLIGDDVYLTAQKHINAKISLLGTSAVESSKQVGFGQSLLADAKLGLWDLVAYVAPKRSGLMPAGELWETAMQSFKATARTLIKNSAGQPLSDGGFEATANELFTLKLKNVKATIKEEVKLKNATLLLGYLATWYSALNEENQAANKAVAEFLSNILDKIINPEDVLDGQSFE